MPKLSEIVYSSQKTGFEPGRRYSNPRFFDGRVKQDVSKAIVVGNWPRIVAAYRKAGVEVEQINAAPRHGGVPEPRPVEGTVFWRDAPLDIPEGWRDMTWQAKRSLASKVTNVPVINSMQAEAAIEAEIDRRAGLSG